LTLIDAFYLRADKAYAGAGQIKRPTKDELEFERLAQAKDEEAVRLLKSGLRLPRFEVPDPQAAARALVGKTSLPSWEEAEVLSMNASWGSIGWPLSLLDNNLHDLTAHLESSGDGKKADDVTRMLLRLVEIQMPHPQPREIGQLYDRRARLLSELGARRDTSSEFTRAEILEADQAITENYARQQQYQSANDGWRYSFVSKRDSKGWVGFAAWACGQLTVLLLLLSAGAYLICRFIAGSATKASLIAAPTIGAWKSLTIWLLAAAVTMTVFGLAPAGIIGHRVQGWAFLVLVSAVLIFPPILAARQSRWSYGTRRLMALVAYYSVVFAVILYIDREHFNSIKHNHELRHLPPKIWMPPHGAGELDGNNVLNQYGPHTLYDVIDGGDSDPDWRPLSAQNLHTAGLQWVVYHGLGWTLALGFFATGMWLLVRARRSVERMKPEDRPVAQKRWLVGVVLRELARSAAIGSLISLAAYLLLAPARIANFEATYQDNILQVLHPDQYWAGLNEQIKKLAPDIDDVPKLPPSIAWQ